MASPRDPIEIKQSQVHISPLPAADASNPDAIGAGRHWEIAEVPESGQGAGKIKFADLVSEPDTVRFHEID
jgi:hypothetical protein